MSSVNMKVEMAIEENQMNNKTKILRKARLL